MEQILLKSEPSLSEQALDQLGRDPKFAELKAIKRHLLEKLLFSDHFLKSPLELEQKATIALATVNGLFQRGKAPEEPWSAYVLRFRACVERALYYRSFRESDDDTSAEVRLGEYHFRLPVKISEFAGLRDVSGLLRVLVIMEDIIAALDVALKIRRRLSEDEQMTKGVKTRLIADCKSSLNRPVKVKEQSFRDLCASWGFAIPITASSLVRMIPALAQQENIHEIHRLFVIAHRGLQQVVRQMQLEDAGSADTI